MSYATGLQNVHTCNQATLGYSIFITGEASRFFGLPYRPCTSRSSNARLYQVPNSAQLISWGLGLQPYDSR